MVGEKVFYGKIHVGEASKFFPFDELIELGYNEKRGECYCHHVGIGAENQACGEYADDREKNAKKKPINWPLPNISRLQYLFEDHKPLRS